MLRRGALAPQAVVELRADQRADEPSLLALTVNGQSLPAEVWLGYVEGEQQIQANSGPILDFASLCYARVQLPITPARELKVWTHTITPDGASGDLSAHLTVQGETAKKEYDLQLTGGQVALPLPGETCLVEIKPVQEVESKG